jgi:hypothetical protein
MLSPTGRAASTRVRPALTATEDSASGVSRYPGSFTGPKGAAGLTTAEPFLTSHGDPEVAVVVTHAVGEAILATTRHAFAMTEAEPLPTPHALGADEAAPLRHERPQLPAPIATALSAPAVFEVSTPPVIAKKERAAKAKAEAPAVAAGTEPLTLVVSINEQKIDVYRGTVLVTSAKVSGLCAAV